MLVRAVVVAVCLVLPLLASSVWTGFRLGFADPVLSVIAPSEQPLSVRSTAGEWAMALAVVWFGLAYWHHRLDLWEVALVVVGGAVALARLGNAWVFALAMVAPLGRQIALARLDTRILIAAGVISLGAAGFVGYTSRLPSLAPGAEAAALSATGGGDVFADWRFAGDLRSQLGARVVPTGGFASEDADFWAGYVRIMQGHEHWLQDLQSLDATVVVVDSADQGRAAANLLRASSEWRVTYDAGGVLVAEKASP